MAKKYRKKLMLFEIYRGENESLVIGNNLHKKFHTLKIMKVMKKRAPCNILAIHEHIVNC